MQAAQQEDTFLGNLEKFKDQYGKAAQGGAKDIDYDAAD